jgi:octaheme c-type cytochrome (tetrathionate reductase family)
MVLATLCLLMYPLAGESRATPADKGDLVTAEDFIEYASANEEDVHEVYFSTVMYEGTASCLMCHQEEGEAILQTGHFKWEGKTDRIAGVEGQVHGKNDLLNNFCVAVPSNEPRCTECHIGYGYKDSSFNFSDPNNIDCLVCHDQTGDYDKGKKSAGMPVPGIDLNAVARSVALGGTPTRKNCIGCHANAGGDDNVKHGDLSTDLIATTREYDVHMGTDGADFDCVNCHGANHDPSSGAVNHGNAGMSLHSVNEGEMKDCTDCHSNRLAVHAGTSVEPTFVEEGHERLACQVCHIPAIARAIATKTEWYWSEAGRDISPIPTDPESGRATYSKKKGRFVWSMNVRPKLRWSNGTWKRRIIGLSDTYDEEPIAMAEPLGDYSDPNAMIYPFKEMIGNQPVDPNTKTILVPHLIGAAGGPNPYWVKWDWTAALKDGAAYAGQNFSGKHKFGSTSMLLSVNHEVAPAEQAFGMGGYAGCEDCHFHDQIEWEALGWSADPMWDGERENVETSEDAE